MIIVELLAQQPQVAALANLSSMFVAARCAAAATFRTAPLLRTHAHHQPAPSLRPHQPPLLLRWASSKKDELEDAAAGNAEDGRFAAVDAAFMSEDIVSDKYASGGEQSFSGSMAPYRPDNWEELLKEAQEAYPERMGPRRNKEAKRQRQRFGVMRKQHKTAKMQRVAAHIRKQEKISAELARVRDCAAEIHIVTHHSCTNLDTRYATAAAVFYFFFVFLFCPLPPQMRAAYHRYGFEPAVKYAAAMGEDGPKLVGLGGRLGQSYFGPLFRDGTFDPSK